MTLELQEKGERRTNNTPKKSTEGKQTEKHANKENEPYSGRKWEKNDKCAREEFTKENKMITTTNKLKKRTHKWTKKEE